MAATRSAPTIAAGYARALLDYAGSRGLDRQALVDGSNLRPDDLAEQDNRVPLADYVALLRAASASAREPGFALQFGEAVRMQDVSIVGLIGEAAETPGEAQRQLNRYARLLIDDGGGETWRTLETVRTAQGAWLELKGHAYIAYPELTETAFARCISEMRGLWTAVGRADEPFPRAVHFTHAEPQHREAYDRVFGCPITFSSRKNAVLIDEAFLDLKLPPTNRYVLGILSERAEALLEEARASSTTRGRVEKVLIPALHTGDAGMEFAARRLGLNRQALYRSLKAEGLTFEQVLDDLRHRLAVLYLGGQKASVAETAYLVGFSDPAAFSRAFKRWTGASPGAQRTPSTAAPAVPPLTRRSSTAPARRR